MGESNLELICPKGNEGLERFLEKRARGFTTSPSRSRASKTRSRS